MTNTLRVLILEDLSTDVELVVHELEESGFMPDWRAAANAREYVRALDKGLADGGFDVILADYSLPGYDALAALGELKRRDAKIPFIVVTGSLEDGAAVECIRQGATDYLLKDRLKRLGPAVTRALVDRREAEERERMRAELARAQKTAEEALRQANAVLEGRVAERTQALSDANEKLSAETAERQRAQHALQQTQKLQATGRLAAGVAHHFNNLLTVMMGSIEMALQTATDERGRRRLTIALQAAERGASLTRQLLSFAGKQMVRPEVIEPSRRLEDIAMLFAGSLRSDIRVETDIPADLWRVEVDATELELAALNLAFNARDAMSEGGVLKLTAANVEREDERLGLAGRYVMIELTDTGPGIADEIMPRIFDPFFTTKEVGAGSGLGLSQVHGFARQAGGAVDVESVPGRGATVRLYLPAVDGAAEPATRRIERAEADIDMATGKVLVVDDDAEVADVAAQMLEHHGFSVRLAYRAKEALELLHDGEDVDLVLADIVMPGGMNGIELAQEVRSRFPELPILLATGHSDSVKDAAAKGLEIIAKPYMSAELCDRVLSLMRREA
ncbi:response regulator [Phenylobacterium sp.]|uniref:response regulator n=1 Tax=Phenylobacterium sp. TaxID=1871053 RepID=UPI0035AF4DC9